MKARHALWVVSTLLAAGCGGGPRLETRTFALRHLGPGEARAIIQPYVYTDRPGAKGDISAVQNAITVRETSDNLDRIARVLAQYDRPEPAVRLLLAWLLPTWVMF